MVRFPHARGYIIDGRAEAEAKRRSGIEIEEDDENVVRMVSLGTPQSARHNRATDRAKPVPPKARRPKRASGKKTTKTGSKGPHKKKRALEPRRGQDGATRR